MRIHDMYDTRLQGVEVVVEVDESVEVDETGKIGEVCLLDEVG